MTPNDNTGTGTAELAAMLAKLEAEKRQLREHFQAGKRQLEIDYKTRMSVVTKAERALHTVEQGLRLATGTAQVAPITSSTPRRARGSAVAHVEVATPPPQPAAGTDAYVREALIDHPRTVESLAKALKEPESTVEKWLEDLRQRGLVASFDIETQTKRKGTVRETFWFWRPRLEVEPEIRRRIIIGLLQKKWWSNADLVAAANAITVQEKRAVDNAVMEIRKRENVHMMVGEHNKPVYWLREDRGAPPPEMEGRVWGPKSKHGSAPPADRKIERARRRRS